jgi:ribonuclease Z
LELYFLGTGAGTPSRQRNVTAIALKLFIQRGGFWLFDCGEGTQHQIMQSPLKLSKLEKLFVTHLHGDHIYGIPGLLTSRSNRGGETPLTVYGPPGIRQYIETALAVSKAHLQFPLDIVEIEEGLIYADNQFKVEVARIEHRIDSYGYRVTESDQPGVLDAEKLLAQGVPHGPLYGQLKQGLEVVLPDGRVVRGADFVGPPRKGRIVTIMGDTRYCAAAVRLSANADVLVHEATFSAQLQELAEQYYHTTSKGAAEIANEAGVNTLIMTHISSRYQDEAVQQMLDEARKVFPRSYIAHDFWEFPIWNRH